MATRALYSHELVEVQHIFGVGLNLARVVISEGNPLPNWVGRIGASIKRCPRRRKMPSPFAILRTFLANLQQT